MITKAIDTIKRNSRIAILIGIVVILAAVTFLMYSGWGSAADQQAGLEDEEVRARNNLNIALDQYNLDKLKSDYDTLKRAPQFPASFPGVDLSAYIAAAAEKYGVTLESLTPKGTTGQETISGKKYNRYEATAKIVGGYDRMNSCLRHLEEGPFTTLRIESLSVTQTDGTFIIVLITR